MLRTFGRVMPVLVPLTSVLIILTAVLAPAGAARLLWIVAAVAGENGGSVVAIAIAGLALIRDSDRSRPRVSTD